MNDKPGIMPGLFFLFPFHYSHVTIGDMGTVFRIFHKCLLILVLAVLSASCSEKFDYQAYSHAKDLYIRGETGKAIEELEKLETNPRFLLPYSLDGRISLFSGDYERAESKLLHVLGRAELDFDAVRWMTQVYLATDRPEEALELAGKALEKYPDEPRLLLALAHAQKKIGNIKDAATSFKRAFLLEEELAYGHFELATMYAQSAIWSEYQRHLERSAVLSDPDGQFNKSINELLKKRRERE